MTPESKLLASLGDMIGGHVADSLALHATLNDVYSKHVDYLATGLSTQLHDDVSAAIGVHVYRRHPHR